MPSVAVVFAAILCPFMSMIEITGVVLGLAMAGFVYFGVAGRWVHVTNQRIVLTTLFGKREMLFSKVESIETKGIATLGLVFRVHGTVSDGMRFIPLRDSLGIEDALRSAVSKGQA